MILGGGYDTIIIPLHSYIQARYIKISLESKNYLHFKKIEIFKRKYPALIVATRFDGSGGRLMAMLNAMYIAKKQEQNLVLYGMKESCTIKMMYL
ncbi:hypothetical protein [Campylobacter lanienae]|uniref:hypothetical protein n=1 Tax=Campylobacter lanienae TaxID=75658 RepID=UPI000BB3FA2A|nr:hypothetical protein [Campylobacter lanienae]